ncbi:MAG: PEGA domain-containing protein [Hyphomicrobiales bacterium]
MNKIYLTALFIFAFLSVNAQNLHVDKFKAALEDLEARINPVMDQNGDKAALIKVRTTQKDFVFEGGLLGITKVDRSKVGEIWVYIPLKSRKLTIKHEYLGVLDYKFPISIESETVYILNLISAKVETKVQTIDNTEFVIFKTEPKGANVYIDDNYIGNTSTDLIKKIPIGRHSYRIEKPLHKSEVGIFELFLDKKVTINHKLSPNYCNVFINSSPEGAVVYLNDIPQNKTTPCTLEKVPIGDHTLSLMKDWYKPKKMTLSIQNNENQDLNIDLDPNFGIVPIKTNPNAKIYVNGIYNCTGSNEINLNLGNQIIKVEEENHQSIEKTIIVTEGQNHQIDILPKPILSSITITSNPIEADIYIDHKLVGTTPKTVRNIIVGKHTITIKKTGYKSKSSNIEIEENNTAEKHFTLNNYKTFIIESIPNNSFVYIDGIYKGESPVTIELSLAPHTIELRKNGYINRKKTINLNNIEGKAIVLDLKFDQKAQDQKTKKAQKKKRREHRQHKKEKKFIRSQWRKNGLMSSLGIMGVGGTSIEISNINDIYTIETPLFLNYQHLPKHGIYFSAGLLDRLIFDSKGELSANLATLGLGLGVHSKYLGTIFYVKAETSIYAFLMSNSIEAIDPSEKLDESGFIGYFGTLEASANFELRLGYSTYIAFKGGIKTIKYHMPDNNKLKPDKTPYGLIPDEFSPFGSIGLKFRF